MPMAVQASQGISARTRVPPVGGVSHPEAAADCGDAVFQPSQARALRWIGPADAVVKHLHAQGPVAARQLYPGAGGAGVFRHVRQRLGHDEVSGGLDRLGQPCVEVRGHADGERRPVRERFHCRGQAFLGEDRRVDSPRELAELLDRLLEFGQGLGEGSGRRRVGAIAVAKHRQGQGQGRQPLLCSIVQVPFDPAAFAVPGLHDPLAGCPYLLQLGLDFRVQPLVFDRYPGRGRGGTDEALVKCRVVDQRRERPPVALHQRDRARLASFSMPGQRSLVPVGIHPPVLVLQRVQQLQRPVTKCAADRCLQLPGRQRPVQFDHQVADRAAGQAGRQQPPQEKHRDADVQEGL